MEKIGDLALVIVMTTIIFYILEDSILSYTANFCFCCVLAKVFQTCFDQDTTVSSHRCILKFTNIFWMCHLNVNFAPFYKEEKSERWYSQGARGVMLTSQAGKFQPILGGRYIMKSIVGHSKFSCKCLFYRPDQILSTNLTKITRNP